MDSSSAVLRASLSALVTVSTSPARMEARHSASFTRFAVLLNLFAEDAFSAGRRQVTLLRRQPGGLVGGGCPRVSDDHRRLRSVEPKYRTLRHFERLPAPLSPVALLSRVG